MVEIVYLYLIWLKRKPISLSVVKEKERRLSVEKEKLIWCMAKSIFLLAGTLCVYISIFFLFFYLLARTPYFKIYTNIYLYTHILIAMLQKELIIFLLLQRITNELAALNFQFVIACN